MKRKFLSFVFVVTTLMFILVFASCFFEQGGFAAIEYHSFKCYGSLIKGELSVRYDKSGDHLPFDIEYKTVSGWDMTKGAIQQDNAVKALGVSKQTIYTTMMQINNGKPWLDKSSYAVIVSVGADTLLTTLLVIMVLSFYMRLKTRKATVVKPETEPPATGFPIAAT